MKWIKRSLLFIGLFCAGVLLHYYLPSRDIVQIVGTEVKRIDIEKGSPFWDRADTGTNNEATRDVRFINAVRENQKPRVYRNEDTGWSFPFYFKFDSSNLTTRAQAVVQQGQEGNNWVAVSHYGWRIPVFSIYPNAYKIKSVKGPNALLIPWFNIFLLSALAILIFWVWRKTRRWSRKNITPHTDKIREEIGEAAEALGSQKDKVGKDLAEKQSAYKGFMKKWFGSS